MTKVWPLFILIAGIVQAQTLQPGLWKGKSNFKVNGIALPANEDEDCILPHEVKDVKASITKNIKKQGCVLTKWEVKGQNLDAALECSGKDLEAKGNLKGQVTQKSYKLSGDAEGTLKKMLPAVAQIELEGQWIKKCE